MPCVKGSQLPELVLSQVGPALWGKTSNMVPNLSEKFCPNGLPSLPVDRSGLLGAALHSHWLLAPLSITTLDLPSLRSASDAAGWPAAKSGCQDLR